MGVLVFCLLLGVRAELYPFYLALTGDRAGEWIEVTVGGSEE